jgi:uncharacterized protein YecE (DUF72 family)
VEVRPTTRLEEEGLTLMTTYDIGFVISQSGEAFPYLEMVTAKNIYVRFHGPAQLYASSYTGEVLLEFAHKVKGLERGRSRYMYLFQQ